jgi:hypothetical protein
MIACLQSFAEIYMQKNTNGSVTYTDTPSQNTKAVSLSPVNTLPSVSEPPPPAPSKPVQWQQAKVEEAHQPYNSFNIISPANNESIQNQPVFTVRMTTDPKLQKGDTIQVYLDGKPWGPPAASTSVEMINVERGQHSLSAKLLDSSQQTLKEAGPITIFVHRVSTNFKPGLGMNTKLADVILG